MLQAVRHKIEEQLQPWIPVSLLAAGQLVSLLTYMNGSNILLSRGIFLLALISNLILLSIKHDCPSVRMILTTSAIRFAPSLSSSRFFASFIFYAFLSVFFAVLITSLLKKQSPLSYKAVLFMPFALGNISWIMP